MIISIVLVIIIAVAGIFVVWKRYGPSNERADLEQYYGLDSKDEIAVVIDDEVIRSEDLAQDKAEGLKVISAKVYDSEYYIEASVVRDKINERFYWDSNEQILYIHCRQGMFLSWQIRMNILRSMNRKV